MELAAVSQQKEKLREVRLRLAMGYRALDSAFRDAYRLMENARKGEVYSRRGSLGSMSDYSWRRARRLCMSIGLLDKRGKLTTSDASEITRRLEEEYIFQQERIRQLHPPAYLNRPAKKKERICA